ncbi:solute carrier family 35 member 2 [Capsaspora owczarzaki ATCC 30864]|uniref:Solute carrier family 35 member 2 n=1 Tax=Capsaspora owczarzaki (strain ATCC 30864) TaxID=595528 RepID=A0A0D2WRX5_CAPO3|nr:solute carrier family 35 member 2 [Capsaspora owczarzaki ATCC 30864]KJE94810.1 solute carrier family 35 member 2 [Capsaspora owczarzaki ATCC 30864]|eukprot:XP_004347072.2 solute carrier family 35 member 2 [Capsaspora owczarzaki ATCC 30864]
MSDPSIRFGAFTIPIKYLSLAILVIQNSTLVLTMRYSRTSEGPMYLSSTAVVMTEAIKLLTCLVIIFFEENLSVAATLGLLHREIVAKPDETAKMGVPSFLYTLQNNLLFVAVSYLDAATFQVTYQLKIITTALFSVIMLGKRLTRAKWIALVVLMVGVALVQLPPPKATEELPARSENNGGVVPADAAGAAGRKLNGLELTADLPEQHLRRLLAAIPANEKESDAELAVAGDDAGAASGSFIGLMAVITACCSSGFAGVYFEKILKGTQASIWVRNVQLGLFGAIIGIIGAFYQDGAAIAENGFFQGYTTVVWLVILMQAFGGLLVAVVVKYADNILKGFATSVSIVVSSIISIFLFGFHPHMAWNVGAGFVLLSTYLYSLPDAPVDQIRRSNV